MVQSILSCLFTPFKTDVFFPLYYIYYCYYNEPAYDVFSSTSMKFVRPSQFHLKYLKSVHVTFWVIKSRFFVIPPIVPVAPNLTKTLKVRPDHSKKLTSVFYIYWKHLLLKTEYKDFVTRSGLEVDRKRLKKLFLHRITGDETG